MILYDFWGHEHGSDVFWWYFFTVQIEYLPHFYFRSNHMTLNMRHMFSINQSIEIFSVAQIERKRERWNYSKMWGNDLRNINVLSRWRKTVNEGDDWMSSGREFQRTDAATGNERRPTVDRRNDGRRSEWVDDDRSRRRPGSSAIRVSGLRPHFWRRAQKQQFLRIHSTNLAKNCPQRPPQCRRWRVFTIPLDTGTTCLLYTSPSPRD